MKNILSNSVAVIWFIGIVLPIALLLWFIPIGLFMDIKTILTSGFSTTNIGFSMFGIFGFIFSITMMVPWFRKCFKKLPWLYSYVVIFMLNILILTIGIAILNCGYEVQSQTRHSLFYALMIIQIIVCRIAMSLYFKLKPPKYIKEQNNG